MMKSYVQNNQSLHAISLYEQFNGDKAVDDVTNILYLKACTNTGNYHKGHFLIKACEQLNQHSAEFRTSTINFYGHFGAVDHARKIFQAIKTSVISLNAMMKCYVNNNQDQQAIDLYETADIALDDVSNILYLKACINMDNHDKGKQLVEQCMQNLEQRDIELVNTVIDFCGYYGEIESARNVFQRIPECKRTIVTINALMNAYNLKREWNQALRLFSEIDCNRRDAYCYSIALNACAGDVSSAKGEHIISDLYKPENSHIRKDCNVQAAMIRYYAKTRQSKLAMDLFDAMDAGTLQMDKTGIIYQAILDCYGKMGCTDKLLHLFAQIKQKNGVKISDQIYSIVLNGCSHSGLIDEGIRIFEEMQKNRMVVNGQVLTAMIDCLGRKNEMDRGEDLYNVYKQQLTLKSKFSVLLSLLSACRTHNDLVRAERVFQEIQDEVVVNAHRNASLDEEIASAYALMANMYAQNGQFDKMDLLRMEMRNQ